MSVHTLYNSANGQSCLIDAGDGLRQKSYLEEISRWLREGVEPTALAGIGLGRVANYPQFLDGLGMTSNPIGQAAPTSTFAGVEFFSVSSQTGTLATGDASAVDFGDVALTEDDVTNAAWHNATATDPDLNVLPPGGSAPAFLNTLADAGGFDLSAAGALVLTVVVNGVTYATTIVAGSSSSVTVEEIQSAIVLAGWPVNTAIEGGVHLRIFTLGAGLSQNIRAATGGAGAVLFTGATQSSQINVTYSGNNGPLGQIHNGGLTTGAKPQRRILPGSITVTYDTTTLTDDSAGALATSPATTDLGTINYATGAIHLDTDATTPSAAAITATYKVLIPLELHKPVQVRSTGSEFAMRLL